MKWNEGEFTVYGDVMLQQVINSDGSLGGYVSSNVVFEEDVDIPEGCKIACLGGKLTIRRGCLFEKNTVLAVCGNAVVEDLKLYFDSKLELGRGSKGNLTMIRNVKLINNSRISVEGIIKRCRLENMRLSHSSIIIPSSTTHVNIQRVVLSESFLKMTASGSILVNNVYTVETDPYFTWDFSFNKPSPTLITISKSEPMAGEFSENIIVTEVKLVNPIEAIISDRGYRNVILENPSNANFTKDSSSSSIWEKSLIVKG